MSQVPICIFDFDTFDSRRFGPATLQSIITDFYNLVIISIKQDITDTQSPARDTDNWVFSAFPENLGRDRDDYPIIICNSPDMYTNNFTFNKKSIEVSMNCDVYTAGNLSAKYADSLINDIIKLIEDRRTTTFKDGGFRGIKFDTTAPGATVYMRGKIKVHFKSVRITSTYFEE